MVSVWVETDVATILEGCCVVEMVTLPVCFGACLLLLKPLRVVTPVETEAGVLVLLAVVALVFEVLVLFDGALFPASLLLFILTASTAWARVGGMAAELGGEQVGEL
jgi:hypothetical protein